DSAEIVIAVFAALFLLLFVPPDAQAAVLEALPELVHVPFRFESTGSQIIFFDPEEDHSETERENASRPIRDFRELEIPYRAPVPQPEAPDHVHG
ncbi:MAG: hypothetical protein KDB80_04660, partial [Planctomycetes bacterium]|nr:hypothetical protein [Planctomycetota bacterium]